MALTAPGSDLTVAAPGGGYTILSSTDMAAALTAGVAALIRSRFPRLTPAQVARALEDGTARPMAARPAPGSGHGALDAAGALAAAAVIAAAQPAPARAVPPPVRTSAARHESAPPAPLHSAGLGLLAGSLLQKIVMVACALIVALGCGLAIITARRRRAQSPRPLRASPRAGQGGSHARRPRAARARPQATGPPHTGARGQPQAFGSTGAMGGGTPRMVPAPTVGGLGAPGRAQNRRQTPGKPPWEPASPPPEAMPGLPVVYARPLARQHETLAPWEQAPAEFAAPAAADPSDWTTSTGPMYVWNPGSQGGPQPVIEWDESQELADHGLGFITAGLPRAAPSRRTRTCARTPGPIAP